ncbi:DNA helicase-2/ATP-dependent DNA helicase PcrA [Sporomusaceae bacterium BoRhaA]|uniref:HelD family protein n=1 Tax=Pelorhabdus rhamnosifermentans TaxID=2772457 RepID=UPI001C0630B7|nr:UvrD-helicase domain-containing protein [Pelorhabdus rhamnosifermentans]MBU2701569.1 DNA helicase-2/ATP-dependent DNA helicase PcrA [Pelorhabdus rhamnosifermentans]
MDEKEQQAELIKLEDTLQQINRQLDSTAIDCNDSRVELHKNLTDYWENLSGNTSDEAQLIEVVTRQKNISAVIHQKHFQLQKMASSPYFGRIDFAEEEAGVSLLSEPIYIGIASLANPDSGELIIYDWRTPIAGMFYDFERGPAFYHCPVGEIRGNITLKRQYKIIHGELKYMFDSEIKIDDDILQEILGRSVDDKMKTIVTSIQREQNRIIRDEGHRLLFVEGAAGSGKSSIALHRVAYLLYRERKTITANNIIIFSPNHIFSDYISNVLPEIGEENVLQITFYDYMMRFMTQLPIKFEERSAQLEYLFTSVPNHKLRVRQSGIRYKSSAAFETILQNYLAYLNTQAMKSYPSIEFNGKTIFSKEDWQNYYLNRFASLPPSKRLTKIRQLIQNRLQQFVTSLRQEKETEITTSSDVVNEKELKALARMAARKDLRPIFEQIERLTALPSPLKLYRRLFCDKALFHRLAHNTVIPREWPAICTQTLSQLDSGQLFYEDSFSLLYFKGILEGFPANYDMKHLVIDEAQDYTILQYKILARLFPHCSWTVLGDPAQSIHPCLQVASFKEAGQAIAVENPLILKLSRSYRSTREIQKFSTELLGGQQVLASVNRPGKLPELMHIQEPSCLTDSILHTIEGLQADGCRSIAVICKTAQEAEKIYPVLRTKTKMHLIATDDATFSRGVVVIPTYLAKGLEFDGVIIVNVDKKSYESKTDRHVLYTSCTRALHRLILCYCNEVSSLIAAIPPELYIETK